MKSERFEKLIVKNKYQVFLFTCPATIPFHIARHPWFVMNKKGIVSRWEVFWSPSRNKTSWGHLHKDFFPPFQGIEMLFYPDTIYWPFVRLRGVVEGEEGSLAHRMADYIEASASTYPYAHQYRLRGPNSNTYIQWILDKFPDSKLHLPWNAFGKGYTSVTQPSRHQ